jgi:hypothetical protein
LGSSSCHAHLVPRRCHAEWACRLRLASILVHPPQRSVVASCEPQHGYQRVGKRRSRTLSYRRQPVLTASKGRRGVADSAIVSLCAASIRRALHFVVCTNSPAEALWPGVQGRPRCTGSSSRPPARNAALLSGARSQRQEASALHLALARPTSAQCVFGTVKLWLQFNHQRLSGSQANSVGHLCGSCKLRPCLHDAFLSRGSSVRTECGCQGECA